MQYCPNCQVRIAGDKRCCPLCGGKLEGKGDPQSEIFPQLVPHRSVSRRVLRILSLTGAGATVVCVLINLLVGTAVWWSLFVAGGVACGILTTAIGITYRRDIPQNIAWETALVILLAILWDMGTGWLGWSLDFVFRAGRNEGCAGADSEDARLHRGRPHGSPGTDRTGTRGAAFAEAGKICAAIGAVHRFFPPVSGRTCAAAQTDCLGRVFPPVSYVKKRQ